MSEAARTRTRLAPDARRAEILAVARRAFAGSDYSSVSLAGVGRRAGVTPGLVNHYFGNKRTLYLAVLRDAAAVISTVVRTDLDELSLTERISRNLDEFLDSVQRDSEAYALLFGARTRSDPEVIELVAELRGATIRRMARNNVGEAEPSENLQLALRVFQSSAEAAASEWLGGRAGREQVHALLMTTLLAILEATTDLVRS